MLRRSRPIPEALRRPRRRDHRGDGRAERAGARASRSQLGLGHLATARGAEDLRVRGRPRRDACSRSQSGYAGSSRRGTGRSTRSRARWRRRWPRAAPWYSSPPKWRRSPPTFLPRSCMPLASRRGVQHGQWRWPGVGTALSSHPDVDMVSFTGSTRAGSTWRRMLRRRSSVSPRNWAASAQHRTGRCGPRERRRRRGRICSTPGSPVTRLRACWCRAAGRGHRSPRRPPGVVVGDPEGKPHGSGGLKVQFDKIQDLIQKGIDEGAKVVPAARAVPKA